MDLETFIKSYERYSQLPLDRAVWDTDEYNDYINALNNSKECSNFYLRQEMEKKQFDYSKYCCLDIASHISDGVDKNGEIDYDNVDIILREWEDGTIGIPIHDGGASMIEIHFCPFCGKKLDKYKADNLTDRQ